jgi:hypothetical protein
MRNKSRQHVIQAGKLFLHDFNQNWNLQNNFCNAAKYKISSVSVQLSSTFARGQTEVAGVGSALLQFLIANANED